MVLDRGFCHFNTMVKARIARNNIGNNDMYAIASLPAMLTVLSASNLGSIVCKMNVPSVQSNGLL